ncbi:putative aminotransferase [Flavobacteria bacterium BAL38]|nr:putative aminotransferase [Flavobacteria bacterium BAL38]
MVTAGKRVTAVLVLLTQFVIVLKDSA